MGLTPLDIHNREFKRGLRGYSEAEVDGFLDEIVKEFEGLLKDNAALRDQVETLSGRLEQYRQMEDTLHKTLLVAQDSADELKSAARKEADAITRQAQMEAERARQEALRDVDAARQREAQLAADFLKFKANLKGVLKAQLELLDEAGHLAPLLGLDTVEETDAQQTLVAPSLAEHLAEETEADPNS